MFSIDGIDYNVKCSVEREWEIKETSISGMLLNGEIFRDIKGTYYSYDIRLEMPLKNKNRYTDLIEQLSKPVDGHLFVLPYNNSTLQLTGKVENPKDVWIKLQNGFKFWDGLEFTIAPNAPTKENTLSGVLTRGRAPLPDVANPSVGDSYTWNGTAWAESPEYEDADNIAY